MRFTDFLKSTVLLTAGEATALGAVTVIAAATGDDAVLFVFSVCWWAIATAVGAWIGRQPRTTERIGQLLANARTLHGLPEVRPGAVLLNRLWPLGVSALLAAGISWIYPQVAAVATGYAILIALAWRKQDEAVTAIEGRDGVRFYVLPSSPFRGMELARTPGYRFPSGNGASPNGHGEPDR
jgi:hypothetical protein